jgi:hypothetical protein
MSLRPGSDSRRPHHPRRRLRPCRGERRTPFFLAVQKWTTSGIPDLPRDKVIQTARHKAIDRIRRNAAFQQKTELYANVEPTLSAQDAADTLNVPGELKARLVSPISLAHVTRSGVNLDGQWDSL